MFREREAFRRDCGDSDYLGKVFHYPVMYKEVMEILRLRERKIVVDCTVGVGSHANKFLQVMPSDSLLVGIDRDEESLKVAHKRLEHFGERVVLVKGDFRDLDSILGNLKISQPEAIFFDLGLSKYQLSNPERGFSFSKEGPLDMRIDRESSLSAYDLVNNLSENELEAIFKKFGEERHSRRIAHLLVEKRKKEPIFSTTQLSKIVIEALPPKSLRYKIHPATRVFQALRIMVNRELDALETGIKKAITTLSKEGRIAVIAFHSLEDRIAKYTFREFMSRHIIKVLLKKPLIPKEEEVKENISSRSAKLRAAEKL